jgi:hypothetical protein
MLFETRLTFLKKRCICAAQLSRGRVLCRVVPAQLYRGVCTSVVPYGLEFNTARPDEGAPQICRSSVCSWLATGIRYKSNNKQAAGLVPCAIFFIAKKTGGRLGSQLVPTNIGNRIADKPASRAPRNSVGLGAEGSGRYAPDGTAAKASASSIIRICARRWSAMDAASPES